MKDSGGRKDVYKRQMPTGSTLAGEGEPKQLVFKTDFITISFEYLANRQMSCQKYDKQND